MAEQKAEKVALTLAQRVEANRLLAADIEKTGIKTEVWCVASGPTPGTQVNLFDPESGIQFGRITVGKASFVQFRDYIKGTDQALLDKVKEATGAGPNQFTTVLTEAYSTGGGVRFDISRLAK